MIDLGIRMSPQVLMRLLPYVRQAAEEELEDERVRLELENIRCEMISRLQHIGLDPE